ncbi:flavin-dependent oxidoreductase (plasmid) [Coraliomargarita sp. W4R53]
MHIVIIGAGIGGLATALSLESAGFRDIEIYERAAEIRGLGVGINLLPHAMRELTELGLADRVAALGVAPAALTYYNRHGELIWSEPRGREAGYRWPQQSVHRGRLQLELLAAVRERLGDIVHTDHRLVDITPDTERDVARFATPEGEIEIEADVIVAADGIHSTARALRNPAEGGPQWSGLTLWRGTAVVPSFLDGRTMIMTGDGEQKFVAYPLSRPDAAGRVRVNFIAERRGAGSPDADWNRSVESAPIAALFEDWRYDWLDVPATIAAADEIFEYPMVDRDALPSWTTGRTTLLGDAAHAMYPNGSNGGSQAIIDARTLAFHLATDATVADALAAYESERRPATAALLEMTRRTGPERVMQLAHERAPGGFADIHDVIPESELIEIAASYKRAAGFHPDVLNARPTLNATVLS